MTKVCSKCGSTKPISEFNKLKLSADGHQPKCRQCFSAYNKARYAAKGDHVRQVVNQYRISNQGLIKSKKSLYYTKNSNRLKEKSKQYYVDNKDRMREVAVAWQKANRPKANELSRKWCAKNPDVRRTTMARYNGKRRAIIANGHISSNILMILLCEQGGKCPGCLNELVAKWHLDHFMPLALGGSHHDNNLQLLCVECNLKKSAKHPLRWFSELLDTCN